MVRGAQHQLCVLFMLFQASWASTPPFWPEENCLNQISTLDYTSGIAYNAGLETFSNTNKPPFGAQSPAVNPYNGRYEVFDYATYPLVANGNNIHRRQAGPMLNDSVTPCRLEAHVGKPLSITVYAEDLDPSDSVRIYVLEDPGIPNNAYVTADESHQRCLPRDPAATVAVGAGLGPCPMCQASGEWTFGIQSLPASPGNVLKAYAANYTSIGTICAPGNICAGASLPMIKRVWCKSASGGRTYGDGKLEESSQHGRLRKRTLTWTPLPEQGICLHATHCIFVIKFQAFDTSGMHSVIKSYEIRVIKAKPQYSSGTFGLIIDGAQESFEDPVTSDDSQVSSTTYQPQTAKEWMLSERVYKAYINCPLEFAIGMHANGPYDVTLHYSSPAMPPAASIEWRKWTQECSDNQAQANLTHAWSDIFGRTCLEYELKGWCKAGGQGPSFASLGGTFKSMARDSLVPADKACCVCGAGGASTCSTRTTAAACEDNTDISDVKRPYPRQNGCKWDGTVCRGTTQPYWVTPGVIASEWTVSPTPPTARRVMAIFKWTPVR